MAARNLYKPLGLVLQGTFSTAGSAFETPLTQNRIPAATKASDARIRSSAIVRSSKSEQSRISISLLIRTLVVCYRIGRSTEVEGFMTLILQSIGISMAAAMIIASSA